MTPGTETSWTLLKPTLSSKPSRDAFVEHARALTKIPQDDDREEAIDELRAALVTRAQVSKRADRQALLAAALVVTDLATQGWQLRVRVGAVTVRPPTPVSDDRGAEKARIRRQELVKR